MSYEWKGESLATVRPEDLGMFPMNTINSVRDMIVSKIPAYQSGNVESYNKVVQGRNDLMSKYAAEVIKNENEIGVVINMLIEYDQNNNEPPLFTDPTSLAMMMLLPMHFLFLFSPYVVEYEKI